MIINKKGHISLFLQFSQTYFVADIFFAFFCGHNNLVADISFADISCGAYISTVSRGAMNKMSPLSCKVCIEKAYVSSGGKNIMSPYHVRYNIGLCEKP